LAAAFAPLMVLVIWLRLEFYVRRNLKVVALVSLLFVNLTKRKMILYAIHFGKITIKEVTLPVGEDTLLVCVNVGCYVLEMRMLMLVRYPKSLIKLTITLKEMKIKKENHLIRRPTIKFSTVICSV
jgi:hypothetical protein